MIKYLKTAISPLFHSSTGLYGLPKRNGKLKDISHFDASFFGVHPKQANTMDPQLRLMLEVAYEAILDGGEETRLREENSNLWFQGGPKVKFANRSESKHAARQQDWGLRWSEWLRGRWGLQ